MSENEQKPDDRNMLDISKQFALAVYDIGKGLKLNSHQLVSVLGFTLIAALDAHRDEMAALQYIETLRLEIRRKFLRRRTGLKPDDERAAAVFADISAAVARATSDPDRQLGVLFSVIYSLCRTEPVAHNTIHVHTTRLLDQLYKDDQHEHATTPEN